MCFTMWLVIVWAGYASAQLGCPMYGCTSGGLFSQADITVYNTADRVWIKPVGRVRSNRTTGCVGNDANILCPVEFTDGNSGYSSFDYMNGEVQWNQSSLHDPSLPILNLEGGAIATDGYHLINMFPNGTNAGNPINMTSGVLSPPTNLLYLSDIGQFFMISKSHGGLYLFGMDGGCTAAYYLLPSQFKYDNPWVPVAEPVIDSDSRRIYILAQLKNESVTAKVTDTRLFSVSINLQPPYLREEWNASVYYGTRQSAGKGTLLARSSAVFIGLPDRMTVLKDDTSRWTVMQNLSLSGYSGLASYTDGSNMTQDDGFLVWAVTSDGRSLHKFNQTGGLVGQASVEHDILGVPGVITSKPSLFGYRIDTQTLVLGVRVEEGTQSMPAGAYAVAASVTAPFWFAPRKDDWELDRKWVVTVMEGAQYAVQGYILGAKDTKLIGYVSDVSAARAPAEGYPEEGSGQTGQGFVFSVSTLDV